MKTAIDIDALMKASGRYEREPGEEVQYCGHYYGVREDDEAEDRGLLSLIEDVGGSFDTCLFAPDGTCVHLWRSEPQWLDDGDTPAQFIDRHFGPFLRAHPHITFDVGVIWLDRRPYEHVFTQEGSDAIPPSD